MYVCVCHLGRSARDLNKLFVARWLHALLFLDPIVFRTVMVGALASGKQLRRMYRGLAESNSKSLHSLGVSPARGSWVDSSGGFRREATTSCCVQANKCGLLYILR